MKGIAISGVTGTGKSLLASTFAEQTDHQLVMLNSEVLFEQTRLRFKTISVIEQYKHILSVLESAYMDAPDRFVTNFTPVDVMAEMYSTFAWHSLPTKEVNDMVEQVYAYGCEILSRYFIIVMHLQPLAPDARKEQLNAIAAGLIHMRLIYDCPVLGMFSVRRTLIENKARLSALKHFVHGTYCDNITSGISSNLKH